MKNRSWNTGGACPDRSRRNARASKLIVSVLLIAALLVLCSVGGAQTTKRTIVHPGKLLDVTTGKTLAAQAIVVEGDKIVSVSPASEIKPSPEDRVIDLPNATALPGLIDAHTHLTFNP